MIPRAMRWISSGGSRRASFRGTSPPSTRNMGGRPALRWMSLAPARSATCRISFSSIASRRVTPGSGPVHDPGRPGWGDVPAHRRGRGFRAEVGARALPGGRIDQRPTSGDGIDLGAAVRAGVDEVRYRNGLAVAWLRVGLRLLTLGLWIASALGGAGASYWKAAVVNALHLAVGGAVLLLLRRRIQVGRVLLLAAGADLLVVAIATLRAEAGDVAVVGYLMGVFEL